MYGKLSRLQLEYMIEKHGQPDFITFPEYGYPSHCFVEKISLQFKKGNYSEEQWQRVSVLNVVNMHNKRASVLGLVADLTVDEWLDVLRAAHGQCCYCERSVAWYELTLDHIIPIAKGGGTTKANTVACCKSCNSRKGVK